MGVSIHAPLARGDGCPPKLNPFIYCFNPRPSCEGRQKTIYLIPTASSFQSTPLLRGATRRPQVNCFCLWFQSTPLLRGATLPSPLANATCQFQSTPLLRGATNQVSLIVIFVSVSIHAPLARGDRWCSSRPHKSNRFNPRPSCEGRRR